MKTLDLSNFSSLPKTEIYEYPKQCMLLINKTRLGLKSAAEILTEVIIYYLLYTASGTIYCEKVMYVSILEYWARCLN